MIAADQSEFLNKVGDRLRILLPEDYSLLPPLACEEDIIRPFVAKPEWLAAIWFPVVNADDKPPEVNAVEERKAFRIKQGLELPTAITPEDSLTIGGYVRRAR